MYKVLTKKNQCEAHESMLFTVEYIYLKNKVFKMSKHTILGKNISSFLTWWHQQKWVIICRFTNLQKPAFPNCETISEKSSDIKSQRSLGTHHLQYIQSKEDDKYYRICARHKAENQYWVLMIFRPWGTTALKMGMTRSCQWMHGLRNTCRNLYLETVLVFTADAF